MKALLPTLLLLLSSCADAPQRVSADARPAIVSLNPCTDAILAEVTAPGQLLAISHYSHDPRAASMPMEQALSYRATSGTVEEVLALGPDVVVAGSFLAPSARAAFERLGVRVETFGIASSVEQSIGQVRQLAALAGDPSAGEAMAAQISGAWDDAATDSAPISTLMWQEGGIVPGPESLIAQLMQHSGFRLHSAARGLGQGAYLPLEQVLADPPDLVLAASDERMLDHPVFQQVDEVSYDTFDPSLLFCGGPSIVATLQRLAEVRRKL